MRSPSRTHALEAFAPRPIVMMLVIAFSIFALPGCSKKSSSNNPGGGPANTFTMTGIMINGTENGALAITILSATLAQSPGSLYRPEMVVGASATFKPVAGGTIALSGTYDTDSDSLKLAGSGYTVLARVDPADTPPSVVGQYDGPNGIGLFGALSDTGLTSPKLFCGSYQSSSTSEAGNIAVLLSGTNVAGIAFSSFAQSFYPFEGTVTGTGTSKTLAMMGSEGGVDVTIDGTYDTLSGTSSGTWQTNVTGGGPLDSGTWSVMPCPS